MKKTWRRITRNTERERLPYNAHPVRERVLTELLLLDALFAGGDA